MLPGKEACVSFGLLTILICSGCTAALPQLVWGQQRQSPQQAAPPPMSPLRIPETPATQSPAPQPLASSTAPPSAASPVGRDSVPAVRDTAPPVPPAGPASVTEPPAAAPPGDASVELRRLYQQAAAVYTTIDSYQARLRRREQLRGENKPEEIITFQFRKEPWSVHFKWIGQEGKNREVVYVKGKYDDKLHTLLAAGDNFLMPAGSQFALAPDSPLIRDKSRHAITEAGIGHLIEQFGVLVSAVEHGDHLLNVKYLGVVRRNDLDGPVEAVQNDVPPGYDPQLPKGGRRLWHFDPRNHLPVLLITQNERGQEVEYYCYDRLLYPKLNDGDFDPKLLWPAKP